MKINAWNVNLPVSWCIAEHTKCANNRDTRVSAAKLKGSITSGGRLMCTYQNSVFRKKDRTKNN
jgi:hypothetical protein